MNKTRDEKLARWLRGLADREAFTATVLAKVEAGDPGPCETKARLFREIAGKLEKTTVEAPPALPVSQPTPERLNPPSEPPSDASRRIQL